MKHPHTPRVQHAGIAMIEVLVALIVLSIGLLGMAAMQITGLRSTAGSSLRTQATLLANDITERMRANPTAIDANAFMNVTSAAINCGALPAAYCSEYYNGTAQVTAATCTPAQMATFDINTWFCGGSTSGVRRSGVQSLLPSATARITCDDTDPPSGADGDPCTKYSPHTVTLTWAETNAQRNAAAATVTQTLSLTLQP